MSRFCQPTRPESTTYIGLPFNNHTPFRSYDIPFTELDNYYPSILHYHSMNWTGGRLSRHSKKSTGALTARQKEHFARVQAGLRSGTKKKPSPDKWSIFDKFHVDTRPERQSSSQPAVNPKSSHADQYPTTNHRNKHRRESTHRSRKETSRAPSHPSEARDDRQRSLFRQPKIEVMDDSDNDIYNASPPPQYRKAKRTRETSLSLAERVQEQNRELLEEKRQKLLSRGDWVGTRYQQPLKLNFRSPAHDENIGRRRRVKEGHRARYNTKAQAHISLYMAREQSRMGNDSNIQELQRMQGARNDVRIAIGGKVVPTGQSSSSGASRPPVNIAAQSVSSDVMLLDEIEGVHSAENDADEMMSMDLLDAFEREARDEQLKCYDAKNVRYFEGQPVHPAPTRLQRHTMLHQSSSATHFTESPQVNGLHEREQESILPSSPLNSTAAHVGRVRPVIPDSQILENEIWETWMAPSEESTEFSGFGSISPGVSTAFINNQDNDGKMVQDESEDEDTGYQAEMGSQTDIDKSSTSRWKEDEDIDSEIVEIETGGEDGSPHMNRSGKDDDIYSQTQDMEHHSDYSIARLSHSSLQSQSPQLNEELDRACDEDEFEVQENRNSVTSKSVYEEQAETLEDYSEIDDRLIQETLASRDRKVNEISQAIAPKQVRKEDSQDKLWMKFVFGDNTDENSPEPEPESAFGRALGLDRGRGTVSPVIGHLDTAISGDLPRDHSSRSPMFLTSVQRSSATNPLAQQCSSLRDQYGGDSVDPSQQAIPFRDFAYEESRLGTNGSATSSSSGLESVSMVVVPDTVSQGFAWSSFARAQKKTVFTKPKPFVGLKAHSEAYSAKKALHIGRGLRKEKSVSSLDPDEVDAIEDD